MELFVDIQVSVLGGHMVTGNRHNLTPKTQVLHLHTNGETHAKLKTSKKKKMDK